MPTCFSIMPFSSEFNDIDHIICAAANKCGLEYIRGDLNNKPGNIMAQIVHEIRQAAVVVADITGYNPNVLYELGIAHHVKGSDRVLIIAQETNANKVYNVQPFRQFSYTRDKEGLIKLSNELPERLRQATESGIDQEFWNVIRGRMSRTQLITRDLERFVDTLGQQNPENRFIRIAAGLSSIAISDNEPSDPVLGMDYHNALLTERNLLRKALLKGARLRAILNPPRHLIQAMAPGRIRIRYERLIGLLQGRSDILSDPDTADDVKAMEQCEFVISPVSIPNHFIIGNEVAYEGLKRAGSGGFEMTHCETGAEGLHELIEQFEWFFMESRREMLRSHPPDGRLIEQLQNYYNEAKLRQANEGI